MARAAGSRLRGTCPGPRRSERTRGRRHRDADRIRKCRASLGGPARGGTPTANRRHRVLRTLQGVRARRWPEPGGGVRRSRGPGEPGGPDSMWHAAWGTLSSGAHRDEAVTSGLTAKSAPPRRYRRPQRMWPAGAPTGGRRGNGRDPVRTGSLPNGGSARQATDPRMDPSREAVGLRRLRGGRDRPGQSGPR